MVTRSVRVQILYTALTSVLLQMTVECARSEHTNKEVRLCNVTLDWTWLSQPVILQLPELEVSSLDRPLRCQYTFVAVSQQRLSLRLLDLHAGRFVENTKRCREGYLKIWDGLRQPGLHLYPPNIFCGQHFGSDTLDVLRLSSGPEADMDFYVNSATYETGFRMEVSYIDLANRTAARLYPKQLENSMKPLEDTTSVCYWQVEIDRCQLDCPILSPGYPGIYPPNTECFYHVFSKNSDEVFQIKASGLSSKPREFNLQKNCQTDYIEVYEGRTKETNKKIGRFCGQDFPNITTATNIVTMFFVSGSSTPPYNYTGFHLSVTGITKEWHQDGEQLPDTLCSWLFNATAGSVSSPEHWLPRKTMCQYSFIVYPGHYLELIIHIYGLQHNCQDYIQVMDGFSALAPLCERSLKESHETVIYNLTSPKVLVNYFITSGQMAAEQSRGFWLSYRQIADPNFSLIVTESSEKAQPVIDYVTRSGYELLEPMIYINLIVPFAIFAYEISS